MSQKLRKLQLSPKSINKPVGSFAFGWLNRHYKERSDEVISSGVEMRLPRGLKPPRNYNTTALYLVATKTKQNQLGTRIVYL
jgi:hypothetical protein